MPISLKNTASILPYVRYSPQANSMTIAGEDNKPREIRILEQANRRGPRKRNAGLAADRRRHARLEAISARRRVPPSPGPNYKRGFSLLVLRRNFSAALKRMRCALRPARTLSFCERFYNESEPNFGKGDVPIVKITEAEPIKVGKGKSRELHFEIVKWIPRPAAITEALAKLKAAADAAPDKSVGRCGAHGRRRRFRRRRRAQ